MATELSYLTKLIDLINRDDDVQSKRRLWSFIGVLAKREVGIFPDKEINTVLNEVHELNLEQIIRVQAYNFYKYFPFEPLKKELTKDFIEMEHCRRRDDFYRFSVAVYQQIENITNYLFKENNLWPKTVDTINSEISETEKPKSWFKISTQFVYPNNSSNVNQDKITEYVLKTNEMNIKYRDKFKIVLFYEYFKSNTVQYNKWLSMVDTAAKLYSARNKVHRGSIDTEYQEKILLEIELNKYSYYLLFSGFLADFVTTIILNNKN